MMKQPINPIKPLMLLAFVIFLIGFSSLALIAILLAEHLYWLCKNASLPSGDRKCQGPGCLVATGKKL